MPITIDGTGTITGLSAGGLPDGTVTTADIADAAVTPTKLSQPLTLATALAYNWNGLTTNTSLDFTGIPSWVKRITVMFVGVSTNGTSLVRIQLGDSGGIENTGYVGSSSSISTAVGTNSFTAGFDFNGSLAADIRSGHVVLTTTGSNVWVASGMIKTSTAQTVILAGDKTLSDVLDRVRITTVNGTDTFDAGSVNILYEG